MLPPFTQKTGGDRRPCRSSSPQISIAAPFGAATTGAADGIRTHDINFGKVACCHYITAACFWETILSDRSPRESIGYSGLGVKGSCNQLVGL